MSESNLYAFRTAVGGFHKGDVSSYIAKTAAAHHAQVEELQARIDTLERENRQLRDQLLYQPAPAAPVLEPEARDEGLKDRELAAYRRAEAAERLAFQRAKTLYGEMQAICDRSAGQLEETDAAAQAAVAAIQVQLDAIRDSVSALYASVRDSAEELHAMGQMVPDPAEGLEEV